MLCAFGLFYYFSEKYRSGGKKEREKQLSRAAAANALIIPEYVGNNCTHFSYGQPNELWNYELLLLAYMVEGMIFV